jgi:hypothetical protein
MNGYSQDFRQDLLRETEEFLSRHLNVRGHRTKAAAAPRSGVFERRRVMAMSVIVSDAETQ